MTKVYFIKSEGKEKQMSKKIVILGAGYAKKMDLLYGL